MEKLVRKILDMGIESEDISIEKDLLSKDEVYNLLKNTRDDDLESLLLKLNKSDIAYGFRLEREQILSGGSETCLHVVESGGLQSGLTCIKCNGGFCY